jgi:hypothetical protein
MPSVDSKSVWKHLLIAADIPWNDSELFRTIQNTAWKTTKKRRQQRPTPITKTTSGMEATHKQYDIYNSINTNYIAIWNDSELFQTIESSSERFGRFGRF